MPDIFAVLLTVVVAFVAVLVWVLHRDFATLSGQLRETITRMDGTAQAASRAADAATRAADGATRAAEAARDIALAIRDYLKPSDASKNEPAE
jgi:hypothetical protein